jgi:hypothetical protein
VHIAGRENARCLSALQNDAIGTSQTCALTSGSGALQKSATIRPPAPQPWIDELSGVGVPAGVLGRILGLDHGARQSSRACGKAERSHQTRHTLRRRHSTAIEVAWRQLDSLGAAQM